MSFPEIRELVPHSGSMLLVRRVVEHSEERTVCEVDPADSRLFFDAEARVPAWVALEWMAQCAAARGGLYARAKGEAPRGGMLLGTRRLELAVASFAPGETVRVSVARVHAGAQMLSFAGEVRAAAGEVVAAARFNVYMIDHPANS